MRKYLRISAITILLSILVCLCCILFTVGYFGSKFGYSPRGVFYYLVRSEFPPHDTNEQVNLYYNDRWRHGKVKFLGELSSLND